MARNIKLDPGGGALYPYLAADRAGLWLDRFQMMHKMEPWLMVEWSQIMRLVDF